jgi:phosphatidylserine/phosphatidylglycerophosphate/cardiolipin synthase-like enzyme
VISDINALSFIPLLLRTARQSLAIQVEYLNDPPGDGALNLKKILLYAAKNGVSVQIMLPPLSPASPGVSSADNNETYRILSPLVAVNVTPRYFIHAKMIIADQRLAFVGSQNLNHQSLHFSREVGILIFFSPMEQIPIITSIPWMQQLYDCLSRQFTQSSLRFQGYHLDLTH